MKAFIKWTGNKHRQWPIIKKFIPPEGNRYVVPFCGSAETVFQIDADMSFQYSSYLLNDINTDLMNLYSAVQIDAEFPQKAKQLFTQLTNTEEYYYWMRDRYNHPDCKAIEKSTILLYLMEHCFRGIYRVNSAGKYNVPYGWYKKPQFRQYNMELAYITLQYAELKSVDFSEILGKCGNGDTVYCDPPYAHVTESRDIIYTQGFNWWEQVRLVRDAKRAAQRGATVIVSNHATPDILELYKGFKPDHIETFNTRRMIKGKQNVDELLAVWGN